jgi:hypothetical protein
VHDLMANGSQSQDARTAPEKRNRRESTPVVTEHGRAQLDSLNLATAESHVRAEEKLREAPHDKRLPSENQIREALDTSSPKKTKKTSPSSTAEP